MASTSALTALRLRSCLGALKPSFLGRRHMKPRTLHPTSYLDGLRGVAALFVVFNHYVAQYFPYITHGWRSGDPALENNDRIVQLPILRAIYSGRFMVTIFFVISGYVLSHKALGLARRRDFNSLIKSLSSSVFRRWLRLMLPALASSIIGLILARTGLAHDLYSDWATPDSSDIVRVAVEAKLPPQREATFQNWLEDSLIMVDPFQFGNFQFPKFNFPLWTMQVEYMGSMIVFVVVLGIALARPTFRVAIPSMLVAFCLFTGRWQWCLFISGVLLAELSHEHSPPPTSLLDTGIDDVTEKTTPPSSSSLYRKILFYLPDSAAFIIACYIGTYPEYNPETSPGYRWLSTFVPPTWAFFGGYFYPVLGSIMLVSALEHGKFLQKIFTTRIAQYLGDISLSMYMLHTQVELSLGNWLVPRCLRFMGGFEGLNFAIGMSMALSCCAILTIWVSDVFWRVVDIKSVKFAKWVSVRCFVEED